MKATTLERWTSLAGSLALAGGLAACAEESGFVAEELAESVFLMRPVEDRTDLSNSLLIGREDGLMVVDAQATPETARELLAAIAAVDDRPVRYLVLSHAHAEAAGGALAFPRDTLVIASLGVRDALADPDWDFGAEVVRRTPDARLPERAALRQPVVVIQAKTEFDDPVNKVEVFPLGHAHSSSDVFVAIPSANLVYAGALLFPDGNPFAGDASVQGWVATLNYLAKLRPAIVVPLRGAPVDVHGVRAARDSLAWLRGQVELGFIDGIEPERIADRVLAADELSQHFDADASPSFVRGMVEQAVVEAVGNRRKRGIN